MLQTTTDPTYQTEDFLDAPPQWDDQTDILEPFRIAVTDGVFKWAGYRLACVADEVVADQPGAFTELLECTSRAIGMTDWELRVLTWFERWLPSCLAQVPEGAINAFMDGVKLAHRRDVLLCRRPEKPPTHREAIYEAMWKEFLPLLGTEVNEEFFWSSPPAPADFGGEVA